MRSLVTFGLVAAFIGAAFVPPSQSTMSTGIARANVQLLSTMGEHSTDTRKGLVISAVSSFKDAALSHTSVMPTVLRSQSWKNLLFSDADPRVKAAYEKIDWAQRKATVALCSDFNPVTFTELEQGMPTAGDLLALCLAKVTGDPARCTQIDPRTALSLKEICETELVSDR